MLKPNGQSGDQLDKVMLLALWGDMVDSKNVGTVIYASMGKPTYPVSDHTVASQIEYWESLQLNFTQAIDYGLPSGDKESGLIMAKAMSTWYETCIQRENILFTVGGAGGLRVVFETFNTLYGDDYRVVTTLPHYTLYADNTHELHLIDIMNNPGYKLTGDAFKASVESAYALAEKDKKYPKMVLLCNPNNPLGLIIEESVLIDIAATLRAYPDLYIVMDEAYTEMCFHYFKAPSLLAIAPDLKHRMIILRSATKALSAAGERMAILIVFDDMLMGRLMDQNVRTIGHAPRSSQFAYAKTMEKFDSHMHQQLIDYYRPKVAFVAKRLQEMGALMPDKQYKVDSTFYILADFSDMLGLPLPKEAAHALQRDGQVMTSEDLVYYLLFEDKVVLAPLMYFGLPQNNGYVRITCSGSQEELEELMRRLEARLLYARKVLGLIL